MREYSLRSGVPVLCLALLTCVLPLRGAFGSKATYDPIVRDMAGKFGVPAQLIHSIIKVESDYDPRAVSSKGAKGLMQLMPATAQRYGVRNVFDPEDNIEGGVRYLKDLMTLYDRDTNLVLAAYNAGQSAVAKYGGIPPYRETIDYIAKIRQNGYRKDIIGNKIYRFVDEKGRTVITNDYLTYKQHLARQGGKKSR